MRSLLVAMTLVVAGLAGVSSPVVADELVSDLAIDVSVHPSAVVVGDEVTYHVLVTNHGPDLAAGVVVGGVVADALVHVGDSCGAGGAPPWTWAIGVVPVGATVECYLVVRTLAPGTVVHGVMVAGEGTDPNPGNDQDDATLTVEPVDPAPSGDVEDSVGDGNEAPPAASPGHPAPTLPHTGVDLEILVLAGIAVLSAGLLMLLIAGPRARSPRVAARRRGNAG